MDKTLVIRGKDLSEELRDNGIIGVIAPKDEAMLAFLTDHNKGKGHQPITYKTWEEVK